MKRVCLLLLILAILSLSSCALLPEEEVRRASPVLKSTEQETFDYTYCTRGDIELTKKFSATYVPIQKVSLYFDVAGERVEEMYVKAGDAVEAGQLLGHLKLDGVEESIESCEKQISKLELQRSQLSEKKELDVKRQHILYGSDAEALKEALEALEESYESSYRSIDDALSIQKTKLEQLTTTLNKRRLIAPISGTVTYVRNYTESVLTSPSEKAVTIADSTMSLFTVNTDYWQYLPEGLTVTITVKKVEYSATVTDPEKLGLDPVEKVEGKKARVYLTLDTPAPDLEDNDKGTFTILLDERRDVLRVSEEAISRAGDDYIVYYETDEGVRSYKTVELGLNAEGMYEVLSGVSEGEALILP